MVTANNEFSVGALHGWHGVLLGLLASGVFMICGRQDLGAPRFEINAAFWFSLALLSAGGVIWLGVGAGILGAVLLGIAFLCSEVWLIRHWWRRGSAQPSPD
jgi:hypothetical protein